MAVKVIIGADFVPTDSNVNYFVHGNMEQVIDGKIIEYLNDADYRVFNLEVPLTDRNAPIKKCGPNLIAPIDSVNGYCKIKTDFLTLANNHIMDQGDQGLKSTMRILDRVGIAYSGVGNNLAEANSPYISEIRGKKIGFYCCAEHEFSIADYNFAGANPFDPLESLDQIRNLRSKCDFVICLYHGGKEHYRYPSPNLQKTCRKIVEKGADLVVCQHSHCIGCSERWKDGTIVYGQGNFLFDHSDSEFWQTSLLISVEIDDSAIISYIPIKKNGNAVRLANEGEGKEIMSGFIFRSEEIKDESIVESHYREFALSNIADYLSSTDRLANSFIFRAFNKASNGKLRKVLADKILFKYREKLINQYECEAHRELILKGLKMYGKQ